jgi:hypothetical protein
MVLASGRLTDVVMGAELLNGMEVYFMGRRVITLEPFEEKS